jgi:predicted nucleic acid-binding protein
MGFDTNILVYAADQEAGERHRTAAELVERALNERRILLPLQTLAEFVHVVRRKLGLLSPDMRALVESWRAGAVTASYTDSDFMVALDAHERHRLTIFDALIWAVCDRMGAEILVTEDLQNGRRLGRVTFLDPFRPENGRRLGIVSGGRR